MRDGFGDNVRFLGQAGVGLAKIPYNLRLPLLHDVEARSGVKIVGPRIWMEKLPDDSSRVNLQLRLTGLHRLTFLAVTEKSCPWC